MTGASDCNRCGNLIVWAFTTTGKKMPLDAAANPHGEFVIVRRDNEEGGGYQLALNVKGPEGKRAIAEAAESGEILERYSWHGQSCRAGPGPARKSITADALRVAIAKLKDDDELAVSKTGDLEVRRGGVVLGWIDMTTGAKRPAKERSE